MDVKRVEMVRLFVSDDRKKKVPYFGIFAFNDSDRKLDVSKKDNLDVHDSRKEDGTYEETLKIKDRNGWPLSTLSASTQLGWSTKDQLGWSTKDHSDKKKLFSVQDFFRYTEAEGNRSIWIRTTNFLRNIPGALTKSELPDLDNLYWSRSSSKN
ncbi:carrier protein [Artemisia annua]|uniref:Carrier protein n=1 Tax=Artemisia annua TaxID=35608 RepID=A0A2U1NFU0_ARTAN|nr:carrier protein [Artemisia annua]